MQTERLTNRLQPKSSFVQDILYEDSQAGVAVVDLFVAVKRAKDKLNILTKMNNEVSNKMKALNKEAEIMKFEYRELMANLNDFFDKMSGEIDKQTSLSPQFGVIISALTTVFFFFIYVYINTDAAKCYTLKVSQMQTSEANFCEKRKERLATLEEEELKPEDKSTEILNIEDANSVEKLELQRTQTRELLQDQNKAHEESKGKLCFSQDLASTCSTRQINVAEMKLMEGSKMKPNYGKTKIRTLNMNPKDVVAALIVTSMRNKRCSTSKFISKKSAIATKQGPNEEVLKLNEANIQMICDICEVISLVIPEQSEGKENNTEDLIGVIYEEIHPKSSVEEEIINVNDLQNSKMLSSSSNHIGKSINEETATEKNPSNCEKEYSSKPTEDKEDNISEGDSVFEEALNEPLTESKTKSSVTCMGDLTKKDNKKSVSTLTTNNGIETSWIGKFKEDIKSKVR